MAGWGADISVTGSTPPDRTDHAGHHRRRLRRSRRIADSALIWSRCTRRTTRLSPMAVHCGCTAIRRRCTPEIERLPGGAKPTRTCGCAWLTKLYDARDRHVHREPTSIRHCRWSHRTGPARGNGWLSALGDEAQPDPHRTNDCSRNVHLPSAVPVCRIACIGGVRGHRPTWTPLPGSFSPWRDAGGTGRHGRCRIGRRVDSPTVQRQRLWWSGSRVTAVRTSDGQRHLADAGC